MFDSTHSSLGKTDIPLIIHEIGDFFYFEMEDTGLTFSIQKNAALIAIREVSKWICRSMSDSMIPLRIKEFLNRISEGSLEDNPEIGILRECVAFYNRYNKPIVIDEKI